jgi:hypothetical protein
VVVGRNSDVEWINRRWLLRASERLTDEHRAALFEKLSYVSANSKTLIEHVDGLDGAIAQAASTTSRMRSGARVVSDERVRSNFVAVTKSPRTSANAQPSSVSSSPAVHLGGVEDRHAGLVRLTAIDSVSSAGP